jgi:DNA polymerase III gamma/tau subunit
MGSIFRLSLIRQEGFMTRGSWWLSAGVAALLCTAGCKQQAQQQDVQGQARAGVEAAQERSQQALDQAKQVQEKARDEQGQVADARQDVEKARQELQEAEAKAQQEFQEAQNAQQQASNQAQQAQAEVQQSQQQALEAQRQQQQEMAQAQQQAAQQQQQQAQQGQQAAQAQPAQAQQLVTGRVVTASPDELLLSSAGGAGQPLRLQVNEQTQVLVNGRQGSVADITEGSQVRASYQDMGGEPTAVRVDVTSSGQQQGTGGSQDLGGQDTSEGMDHLGGSQDEQPQQ